MATAFQSAQDRAEKLLEDLDPGTVRFSFAPAVDVKANVGFFRRQRVIDGNGYDWMEFGGIIVRRAALTAAGLNTLPESGQTITTGGKTYRVKFVAPDSTSFVLDCVLFY